MWTLAFGLLLAALAFGLPGAAQDAAGKDRPIKIVALGDSLTAGYGLPASEAFPAKLQRALKARKVNVEIVNAGVSGDTATGGLERLDWAVTPDTDAVIVALGANDMLRGIDHSITRRAIDTIVRRLRERRIAVLLCGMLASPNLGQDYANAFNRIFSDVAAAHGALHYPFFLDGVAASAKLNQPDGLHPTAAGIDVIVSKVMPSVEQLIARVKAERNS